MALSGSMEDVLEYNRHLRLLDSAGVPLELSDEASAEPIARQLDAIEAALALSVSRGEAPADVLVRGDALPERYRRGLAVWLACDGSPKALDAVAGHAREVRRVGYSLSFSMLQPLILCILGLVVFSILIFRTAPAIAAQYAFVEAKQDLTLSFLLWAGRNFYIWLPIAIGLIIAACYLWLRHAAEARPSWLPGYRGFVRRASAGDTADCLSSLHGSDIDPKMKLQLAGVHASANDMNNSALPGRGSPSPFLDWIHRESVDDPTRFGLLGFATQFYRRRTASTVRRWHFWMPVVFSGALGCLIVGFYGVSLFSPLISLLKAIVAPTST